ncbi:MAG: amidoligase family protein [Clostridia bacterium]|nr:amidoligase family protein [Clostridia bacterium]
MKNQTFGIEIETTGLSRERTAKAIAAYFGTQARYVNHHLGGWHIPMPDGRKWIVERDASVTDPAAEVVSPVCRWEDIEMVQAVVRCIKQAGARADSSCGIHIHVGLGEHTPQSLRRLVNIVNAKEDLLTMALGISPNRRQRWCKPVDPNFLRQINLRKPASICLRISPAMWHGGRQLPPAGFPDFPFSPPDEDPAAPGRNAACVAGSRTAIKSRRHCSWQNWTFTPAWTSSTGSMTTHSSISTTSSPARQTASSACVPPCRLSCSMPAGS